MSEDALFDVLLEVATAKGSAQKGENYLYKNADAEIVGVLRVLSSGVFIIAVRSDSRRQGIATALLDAAAEGSASLKPDFSKTTYSKDGQALVDAYLTQNSRVKGENEMKTEEIGTQTTEKKLLNQGSGSVTPVPPTPERFLEITNKVYEEEYDEFMGGYRQAAKETTKA